MSLMLQDIINSTKLDPAFCAELVGVAPDQFQEWLAGAPLPRFVIPELFRGVVQDDQRGG